MPGKRAEHSFGLDGFKEVIITALPMSIRAGDDAQDAELELQIMLSRGESVKGKAKEGVKKAIILNGSSS